MKMHTYYLFTMLFLLLITAGFINNYSPAELSSVDSNSSSETGNRLNALWKEIGNEVFIQIQNAVPNVEMLYGEITLESGRRIAVELGKPNEEGRFTIKNTFGKFTNISIYTDLDLESDK